MKINVRISFNVLLNEGQEIYAVSQSLKKCEDYVLKERGQQLETLIAHVQEFRTETQPLIQRLQND